MALFPIFAELDGRPVLVIGGGEVATRKVQALLKAGAQVRVHAHALSREIAQWVRAGQVQRIDGAFDPAWIDQAWLVVAATDDIVLNRRIAAEAGARLRWVNVVDDLALSSYHVPSVVDRAPIVVAISSGGHAPMLARRIRERLEAELDQRWAVLAALFARWRPRIRARLPDTTRRRHWFEQVLDGEVAALAGAGEAAAAERALERALAAADDYRRSGSITLIDCGDGSPDLLTLRALRALNLADLVLAGPGVPAGVLELARRDAGVETLPAHPQDAAQRLGELLAQGRVAVCTLLGSGHGAALDVDRLAAALDREQLPHLRQPR